MKTAIMIGLILTCGIGFAQTNPDAVEPSPESRKMDKAAEEFARTVASERTAQYAKVFDEALAASRIPAISQPETPAPAPAHRLLTVAPGDRYQGIFNDSRYFTNLYETHATKKPKIWGGQPVASGAFPDVVAVLGANDICSGTLIAPAVVLTAAHCYYLGIREKVVFGNDAWAGDAVTVEVDQEKSVALAESGHWSEGDLALLFLKTEITSVTPRRIARPEWIRNARTIRAVGFGYNEKRELGIKSVVDIPIVSHSCDGRATSATGSEEDATYYRCGKGIELVAAAIGRNKDTCGGDSGGPVYVDGPDGNIYLAAATSRVIGWSRYDDPQSCGDGGIYARADTAAAWAAGKNVTFQFGQVAAMTESRATVRSATTSFRSTSRPAARFEPFLAAGASLKGKVTVAASGDTLLIPDTNPELRIPVLNLPDAEAARELPVTVKISSSSAMGVEIGAISLSATAEFSESRSVLTQAKYPKLTQAVEELDRSFAAHLRQPQDSSARTSLRNSLGEAEMIAALALQRSDRGTARFYAAKEVHQELRRTNKAFYNRNDRYPPMTYRRIFDNTRGSVALTQLDDGKPFCSGVLVSPEYVMTNDHCAKKTSSTNVEVRFNYELDLDDVALPTDGYAIGPYEFLPQSDRPLDVVFLKLDRPAVRKDGSPWPAQCLSTRLVGLEAPVYVVGHPLGGFRTVADNAHALFPFQVTKDEWTSMRGRVVADYDGLPAAAAILDGFDAAYQPYPLNQTETVYRYYSDGKEPVIGIDSDTAEGNSGSPVYSRRSHRVVGLFKGGIEGEHTLPPGFAFHETVIPMSEIVRQMEEQYPFWTEVVKPCIDGVQQGQKCDC